MSLRILSVAIKTELDVVAARQRARQVAALCGFGNQDQVRIATSVSELARNVYNYAGSGKIEFSIEGATSPQILLMRISDHGPGIAHLDRILSGNFHSATGMGLGILGARRLMDRVDIKTETGHGQGAQHGTAHHGTAHHGTDIVLQKLLPREAKVLTPKMVGALCGQLSALPSNVTLLEVQLQNQELMTTLAELKARQEELLQLTRELEDTNRGVVALYAELDEKADHLRRADQMKSRFLSNMSHEFRTPLSSIRALSKLLLDRVDGDLSPDQEKQVSFILQGAVALNDLVNDLLDLAKIEAGKVEMRPLSFDVADMFSALRGMLRPLLVSETLNLTFHAPQRPCLMFTDEAKLSQILRNFISNALKFTEAGAITISAQRLEAENCVQFSVSDTGLGIAADDLELIFEEFSQVENHLQSGVKGTGLGLPLCRNLATLLGGRVAVHSTPGAGSVFSAVIPVQYIAPDAAAQAVPAAADDDRIPVLVIEDHAPTRMLYDKFLMDSEFRAVPARSLREADDLWVTVRPAAVILDIMLHGQYSWHWLAEIKNDPQRLAVPVVIATEIDDKRKGLALGADAYYIKPLFRHELLATLRQLTAPAGAAPAFTDPGATDAASASATRTINPD